MKDYQCVRCNHWKSQHNLGTTCSKFCCPCPKPLTDKGAKREGWEVKPRTFAQLSDEVYHRGTP